MKIYDKADYSLKELALKEDAKPIAETDGNLDLSSVLQIDGRMYSGCVCGNGYLIVEEIGDIDEMPDEFDDDEDIYCPFCNERIRDSFEKADENENYECDYCHSIFAYERRVRYYYHMRPVSANERITVIEND